MTHWKKIWKILLPILFALAIALGILQKNDYPYQNNKLNFKNQKNSTPNNNEFAYFYNKAQNLAQKDKPTLEASFLAVGDVMLSRNVAKTIEQNCNTENCINNPYKKVKELLRSTNFNFGNLESPLDPNHKGTIGGRSLTFSAPSKYVSGLRDHNFQILNFANNHALDLGLNGLKFTLTTLLENNIQSVGVGENLKEAWQPKIVEANGIKIGFVGASYASVNDNGKTRNNHVARIDDLENLQSSILYLKIHSDFVVATMHAGTEYTNKPNSSQTNFARSAIDFGADLVIGGHPHWIQTVEKYCPNTQNHSFLTPARTPKAGRALVEGDKPGNSLPQSASDVGMAREGIQLNCDNPKYIFYSLGNFIFDQEWSKETKQGLTLKVSLEKTGQLNPILPNTASANDLQGSKISAKIKSIELIPIIIENYSTPRLANEQETKNILKKINIENKFLY